ncbi:MAG TPA: class I SAM-dependent methyltransferase [Chitinophagaceae bacterium]|nr:class I SAM-dependent methyltransferase [Chitinophagaceae bacterium]
MSATSYSLLNINQTVAESDPFTVERYLQFIRHFNTGTKTVLDIGCATGRGGAAIRQKCPGVVLHGLDIVEERINKIKQDGIYDELYVASATGIPVKEGSFDAVVAGEFIEHISPDDIQIVLTEIHRVLVKGGLLFLTTPNPKSILVRLGRDSVLTDPAHLSILRIRELKEKLQLAGFKNITVRGSGKASRIFGEKFPVMGVYGSYLIFGVK